MQVPIIASEEEDNKESLSFPGCLTFLSDRRRIYRRDISVSVFVFERFFPGIDADALSVVVSIRRWRSYVGGRVSLSLLRGFQSAVCFLGDAYNK